MIDYTMGKRRISRSKEGDLSLDNLIKRIQKYPQSFVGVRKIIGTDSNGLPIFAETQSETASPNTFFRATGRCHRP
jgi:hypothetical protein